jgi:hypothetical protein
MNARRFIDLRSSWRRTLAPRARLRTPVYAPRVDVARDYQLATPSQFSAVREFDFDGTLQSIPAGSPYIDLLSAGYRCIGPTWMDSCLVSSQTDPTTILWRLMANGVPIPPWSDQMAIGTFTSARSGVIVSMLFTMGDLLMLQARNTGAIQNAIGRMTLRTLTPGSIQQIKGMNP